jgi:hypothetical protein
MLTTQTASFATVSAEATGRASTMFNAGRQLGAATGVALLTTAIGIVGASHHVSGHLVANLDAYRVAFPRRGRVLPGRRALCWVDQ